MAKPPGHHASLVSLASFLPVPRSLRVVVSDPVDARALRDAGFEVILVPAGQSADQLAETVLCEDADAALVPGSGDSLTASLEARGAGHVVVAGEVASLLSALVREGQ